MSAHTPGPWKATPPSSVVGIGIAAQPDPRQNPVLIASVLSGVADGALIAAAPDLLAALADVMTKVDEGILISCGLAKGGDAWLERSLVAARAAIAKARGGT